jgi:hypothetical protein
MSYTLKKNGKIVTTRDSDDKSTPKIEKHWWLTWFKPLMISKPEELTMDIDITLKDVEMRDAFVDGLEQKGYKVRGIYPDVTWNENTVHFIYAEPKQQQPSTDNSIDKIMGK